MPRFEVEGREGDVTLLDVIAAVADVASDEREVTAVVLHMLGSGSIRFSPRRASSSCVSV